jgi:hypothetical protein
VHDIHLSSSSLRPRVTGLDLTLPSLDPASAFPNPFHSSTKPLVRKQTRHKASSTVRRKLPCAHIVICDSVSAEFKIHFLKAETWILLWHVYVSILGRSTDFCRLPSPRWLHGPISFIRKGTGFYARYQNGQNIKIATCWVLRFFWRLCRFFGCSAMSTCRSIPALKMEVVCSSKRWYLPTSLRGV